MKEKTFVLKGDIEFSARSIDDAFLKLARHFLDLHDSGESHLIQAGKIEVAEKK